MWPMIASLLASKLGQGQGQGGEGGGGMSIPNPIGSMFSELSNAAMRAGGKEPVQNQHLGQQIIQPRSIAPAQQAPASPAPQPQSQNTTMNALQGLIDQDGTDKLKLLTAGRYFS